MKTNRYARSHLFLFTIVVFLTFACVITTPEAIPTTVPVAATGSSSTDAWLEIYFTNPDAPTASEYEGGPDRELANAIDAARLSVDVAIYNLNLWSVRNALLDAHARGVVVRLVAESDNLGGEEFQDLIGAGIPVLGDRRESLMHDKFIVIDRSEVWTGSMNFTIGGAYEDNNNLLRLESDEIAEDYLVEFNEMYEEDLFGNDTRAFTPHPQVIVGNTVVEIYFSPDDGVQNRIVDLLNSAEQSIYFMAYSFTADELGESIRSRAAAGVTVAGVMEEDQAISNMGTEYESFLQAGLDVRLDGNEGQMHHKVIIIDGKIVITGSYNFTAKAEESNDENVLIIHDTNTASTFTSEFWRIYTQAKQP